MNAKPFALDERTERELEPTSFTIFANPCADSGTAAKVSFPPAMIMVPATAPAAATGAATFLRRLVHLFCLRSRIGIYSLSSSLFRRQSYTRRPPHPTMARNSLRYLERSIIEHAVFLPDVTFSNIGGLLEIKISATVPIVVSTAAVYCSRTTLSAYLSKRF